MSTNSQEPVRLPDGRIQLSVEQSEQLFQAPISLARAEAETMIAKGVAPDIAFRHLESGYQKSYAARARYAAESAAPQPTVPAPATADPPAPVAPTAPLAAPGTPPAHEIPAVQAADESLGAFFVRRGAAIHQSRQAAGDGTLNLGLPMGLKPRH
jgi:hypothetical protein